MNENGVSTESNAYDVNGNRTSRKVGANTRAATYDAKDRLIAQGGVNYVFDADGFLRSRGTDTFAYGTRGELLSANVGGVAVTYVYDTQARLVARTQGSSKIEYLYGNLGEPFQLTAVKEAGVLTYHHYDPSGRLMAFDRGGARYFVQTDQVGTPRVVTDAAGNVVKQIRTSAFGEVLSDSAPAFKMYVGYAGGISDSQTGLVRFGFRDYEPLSGRWTARDPILFQGGQGNLYVYVGNSPIILRDPDGLYLVQAAGTVLGGTLAGLDSYNNGDSPGTIAKKVAVGAVSGFIGTLPIPGLGTLAAGFATGAFAGFGQNLANQAIDKNAAGCSGSPLDFGSAGISGLVGGAAGAAGSAFGFTRTPGTSGGSRPLFPEYRGSGAGLRTGINVGGNVFGGFAGFLGDHYGHKLFP